jgi:hypothetical protein
LKVGRRGESSLLSGTSRRKGSARQRSSLRLCACPSRSSPSCVVERRRSTGETRPPRACSVTNVRNGTFVWRSPRGEKSDLVKLDRPARLALKPLGMDWSRPASLPMHEGFASCHQRHGRPRCCVRLARLGTSRGGQDGARFGTAITAKADHQFAGPHQRFCI